MKRLCVIGDSHLAAMHLGWNLIKDEHPEIEATFFGSPSDAFADLRVENGALVPDSEAALKHVKFTSGGETEIRADRYDVFAVVALGFSISKIVAHLYKHYRCEEHRFHRGASQFVSNACFNQALTGMVHDSLALTITRKLRSISDRPILVVPQALPSNAACQKPFWDNMTKKGDYALIARSFDEVKSNLRAEGQRILEQPEETKNGDLFTKDEYRKGSLRLHGEYKVNHPDNDFSHMNPAFGALSMEMIASLV